MLQCKQVASFSATLALTGVECQNFFAALLRAEIQPPMSRRDAGSSPAPGQ